MVISITKDNFQELVLNAEGKVLLDFWAPWCGPCRSLAPVLDKIGEEYPDLLIGKINVDEQRELADAFSIRSIPTLVVMEKGKAISTSVGGRPKAQILAMLDL